MLELPTTHLLDLTGDGQAELVVSSSSTYGALATGNGSRMAYVYSVASQWLPADSCETQFNHRRQTGRDRLWPGSCFQVLVAENARLPITVAGDVDGNGIEELAFGNLSADVETYELTQAIFTAPNAPTANNTGTPSTFVWLLAIRH